MAILHIDGFDHYGTDTARMTEGVYDQVDVAFTLSEVNPRTGARCLRRDDSVAFSEIRRGLGVKRETVGAGVALNLSQLPDNLSSYEVASVLDENQNKHVRFYIQPDGSVQARSGVSNAVLASSSAGVIDAGRDLHFEFGVKADSGIEISTSMPGIQNAEFSGKSAQPSETSNDYDAEISDDGKYLYVLNHSPTSAVFQYEFGTVGDLDTISYTGRSLSVEAEVGARNAHSIAFGDSGRKIYVTEASTEFLTTYQYNLTTAWELDTGSYSGRSFNSGLASSYQVQFNLSGTKMFVLTDSTNDIRRYSLSSAWNIDTDSYDSVLFDYSDVLTQGHNFRFSKNGLRFYVLDVIGNTIFQFSMPESRDIENASYDEVFLSTQEQASDTHGFILSSDESRIYVVDTSDDTVYEYLNAGTIDLSDGIVEVRVDGVTVISASDAKTIYSDDRFYSAVALHCGSGIAHGVTTDIDDFYIWDDQGAWNNSFLGDRRALLVRPNQDTNIADFDPSSGSFGYKMVDDDSPDDDSTYIIAEAYLQSGSPLTGTSELEIEDLPDGTSIISAVNIVTRASKTDSTSAEVFTSINSGVDSLSQSAHVLTTSYQYYSDIYEYDPATIANITREGFNSLSVSVTADDLDPGGGSPQGSPGEPPGPEVPQDFLAHWTGINVSGATLVDESANGHDGTISGAVVIGDYLDFDGTNDRVSLPNAAHPGGDTWTHVFTFDADDVTNDKRIWSARSANQALPNDIPVWRYGVSAGNLVIQTVSEPTPSTFQNIQTNVMSVSIDTKYTVIVEMDNRVRRTYVNGSLVDTQTHTSGLKTVQTNFIGTNRNNSGNYYNGGWRLGYVYDRVLTAEEKTAIFNEAA